MASANRVLKNDDPKYKFDRKLLIGTPTRGTVRMEWALARYGQIIPTNWSASQTMQFYQTYSPLGFMVADAQNLMVKEAVEGNYEWLLLIEDDTMPPPDAFIQLNEYIRTGDIPIVSGLYFTKSEPPEPLIYRGRGNSFFTNWKFGDKVWCDGVPTGFLLIHCDILKLMWSESTEYLAGNYLTRRVFYQPGTMWIDPETATITAQTGTSDLAWCDRVISDKVIERAGWPKIGKRKYPFLVDTSIMCQHIAIDGTIYPQGLPQMIKQKSELSPTR